LLEGVAVDSVERQGNGIAVTVRNDGGTSQITGSHLLVATGRQPVVDGLGLDAAGVAYSEKGLQVDARLRTSNRRVFALGDVIGGYQFTHVASYQAGIVIRNALFRISTKARYAAVPWVTFTDPEIAHVGHTEETARKKGPGVRVFVHRFDDNDRARAELETDGFIKVIVGKKGRVLGATIVGARAGELILPWVLAINEGLKIGALANMVVPYPTLGEVSKRVAGAYYTPILFGAPTRRLVRLLARLPRI